MVSAANPYWTDTNSYDGLWEKETTNTTQTLDTGITASFHASNMPSVASGPAWTIVGTNSQGRVEHGYTYAGIDDRHFLNPTTFGTVTNGTISFWMYVASVIADGGLVAFDSSGINNGDGQIYLDDNGASDDIVMGMSDASTLYTVDSNGTTVPSNQWVHVACTFGSGGMHMYVNGIHQTSTNGYTGGFTKADNRWCFGDNGLGSRYFVGQLDQVAISRYAWSSNAIFTQYSNTNPTNNLRARP